MAMSARYSTRGTLAVQDDALAGTIVVSRNASGLLFVNGGSLPITGGIATVTNTRLIQLYGNAGDDVLVLDENAGALPRATIAGGDGNDAMFGGSADDLLVGDAGNDQLSGLGGDDLLYGGDGNDQLFGNAGNDVLFGGRDSDDLFGRDGDDRLVWNVGDGADLFEGGNGVDTAEVNGGAGNDVFTIAGTGLRVRIDRIDPADPIVSSVDAGAIEVVEVNLKEGDDRFTAIGDLPSPVTLVVDGGAGNDTIAGSSGADRLLGGAGNDLVEGRRGPDTAWLGAGDDVFLWNPGDGSDTVEGQDGRDALQFNGSNGAEVFTLSANGSRAVFTRNVAAITMDLGGVEALRLNALGGADAVSVKDMSGSDVGQVDVDLAGAAGGGDGAADSISVDGTPGADNVDIVGAGATATVLGLAARVDIAHAEGTNDVLVVAGLDGDDRLTATSLPAGALRISLDGGGGNDVLMGSQGADQLLGGDGNDFVQGDNGNDLAFLGAGDDLFQWEAGDGSDAVEGQDGSDALLFFGANVAEVVDLRANGGRVLLQRDVGNVTMDLNDIERVELRALGGVDNIVVRDLTGTGVTRVDVDLRGASGGGDGADDRVTVDGTFGDDLVRVVGDAGGVVVSGLPAVVNAFFFDGRDRLVVNAAAGNDVVDATSLRADGMLLSVLGGPGNDLLIGGAGDDEFTGGDGNDTALMGAGDDTFVWSPGDDNDIVEGQSGVDTLQFRGANVTERITLGANGGRAVLTRDIALVTLDLNDVEHIDFKALGGADAITIDDLSGTDVTEVDIDLSGAAGGGDGAADLVTLFATAGDDVVVVTGAAGEVSIVGLAASIRLIGFEANLDRLSIVLLGGADVLDASGLPATGPLLIADGGDGNDVLIGGDGNDVLIGGSGDDVLIGGPGNNVVIQLVGTGLDPAAMF